MRNQYTAWYDKSCGRGALPQVLRYLIGPMPTRGVEELKANEAMLPRRSVKMRGSVSGGLQNTMIALTLFLGSEQVFAQATPGATVQAPSPMTYSVGDRLKLSFYEPLSIPDKGDWTSIGKPQLPGPSYYQHPELSGDYSIQSDWTISIPIIGTVIVAHRDAKDVEADLTKAFERIIGHSGFMSISVVERKPLYIIGPVKQQGSYKYEPGLTPLNLVALAGGVLRNQEERWGVVEAVREAGKEEAATDRLCLLLAQNAVLRAELHSAPIALPAQLVRTQGDATSRSIGGR